MYSCFIKNLLSLNGKSIAGPELRVVKAKNKYDILTRVVTSIEVIAVPTAATEGNVIGMMDEYGIIVYEGIIKSIEENTIQANQIWSIFDDLWKWNDPQLQSLELDLASIIDSDYQHSTDTMLANIFNKFSINVNSSTEIALPSQDNANYTMKFLDFIIDLYKNHGILTNINIPFKEDTPTIDIGVPNFDRITLNDSTEVLRNFNVFQQVQETNKLVIYDKEGTQIRATYYATPSGITTNPAALNRLPKINTKIVFSDDDLDVVVANNLSNTMYNHEITLDLILNNKLYNFNRFHLGQPFDIFIGQTYYDSILTGYELEIDERGFTDYVHLTFGLVRNTLESKLYKYVRS